MTFFLINNLDKKEYSFSVIDDKTSKIYHHFKIMLKPNMPDGEYTYRLMDGENVVACGLAQIGDYTPTKITYNKPENGYIQYE